MFNDRERADVRAYLAPRVREADVEELILYVLSDFMDAETKWDAVLTISKQFLAEPREDGNICPLASFFLFDLRPFDRHAPDPDKRRAVDKLIAETAASVRNYTAQRRRSM